MLNDTFVYGKCKDFLTSPRTAYQCDRYPFIVKHYHCVKEIGLEKHLEEERRRTLKGIILIHIRKWKYILSIYIQQKFERFYLL